MNNIDIIINLLQANQKVGEVKDEVNERIKGARQNIDDRNQLVKELEKVQDDLIRISKKFLT